MFNLCVRKTPPEFDWNRLFSVLWKHNALEINASVFSKNLHNPEVPGSNPGLATKPLTKVRGFFNAKPRNKLAWLSGWALKKPTEREAFSWKALGKATFEDDSERSEAGNPGLATWKSRTYVKSWVLCCFCDSFSINKTLKVTVYEIRLSLLINKLNFIILLTRW